MPVSSLPGEGGDMFTRVKRLLVAATVIGLAGTAMPIASAGSAASDTVIGGCGYSLVNNATMSNDAYVGYLHDVSVTADTTGTPTYATVSCKITINGADAT